MSSRIFIEPLRPLDELLREATDEDLRAVTSFTSASRRREALAWRALARCRIGRDVRLGYDEWGAPVIENYPFHISVSHSRRSVAVIVSDSPCAIDIESRTRDFGRVLSRYLSPQEQALSAHPDFRAVAWCAKECLYKYHRRGGIDLLRDLQITAVDFAQGTISGTILGGGEIGMRIGLRDDEVVVATE